MVVSDKVCYLQLHRTASIVIASLLKKYIPNTKQIGIHNRASDKTYNSNLLFIGSVRNPWDWYISMWAKGSGKVGILYNRLTDRKIYFDYLGLKTNPLLSPYIFFQQFYKPINRWRDTYSDVRDPKKFRAWLKLMYSRKYDPGTGFGLSSISKFSGHMTFRYLTLFAKENKKLFNNNIKNYIDLNSYDKENNVIKLMIRNEELLDDFFKLFNLIGIDLTEELKMEIRKIKKTNVSLRSLTTADYYDDETKELVANREKLIINKYNYKFPI